jgi:hypothetical protein
VTLSPVVRGCPASTNPSPSLPLHPTASLQLKEKSTPAGGEDAAERQRVKEVLDAANTLHRTLGFFLKSQLDLAANQAALHEDIANLYPADQPLSLAVAQLHSSGQVFHDAPAMASGARAGRRCFNRARRDRGATLVRGARIGDLQARRVTPRLLLRHHT